MIVSIHKCRNVKVKFPILAWAIMFLQHMLPWKKKSWSHMAMSYTMENSKTVYFDCTGRGCLEQKPEEFFKHYEIIESHELAKAVSYVEFYNWFKPLNGRKYDNLQLIGLLLKFFGLSKLNKIGHNLRKLICCELIMSYMINFYNYEVVDTDDYDLLMTWNIVKEY